jgi:hypothetical protein
MSDISNEKTFILDLQLMYADIVTKIFNSWTHLDDDACEHVSIGTKQVWTMNSVTAVYQPIREKGEIMVEEGCVILYPNKESENSLSKDKSFSSKLFENAKPYLKIVEDKIIESYNSYITKYGGWIEDVPREGLNFEKLANILKPLHYDEKSKKLKIKWSIKYLYDGVSRDWNPVELMNWMYSLPAYIKYRKDKDAKEVEEIEGYLKANIEKYANVTTPSEIELRDTYIKETNEFLSKLRESSSIGFVPTLETKYNDGYDDEYIKEKVYKGFKTIGEALSGSKRKSDDMKSISDSPSKKIKK